jgi:hypothetical protein
LGRDYMDALLSSSAPQSPLTRRSVTGATASKSLAKADQGIVGGIELGLV